MPQPRAPHSEDHGGDARGSGAFSRFLSGLAAFSAGVVICGACSSYSAGDPSFNMAVARVRDVRGASGPGPRGERDARLRSLRPSSQGRHARARWVRLLR